MKIELLYFEGCPNHKITLANLKELLDETGIKAEIKIIDVESPEEALKYRFLGSPSIRINDTDLEIIEDASTEYSMRCRRYKNGETMEGFPSKELIKANLTKAKGY